jgi:hypothetical protein
MHASAQPRDPAATGDPRPPARIHILLARTAPVGVVLRRGPSKFFCAMGWNRLDDSFMAGQWFKGRVYERRSDLSPDGQSLLYFAMEGKPQPGSQGAWTAISRAPYFKPVAQWTKPDCWNGGGLFIDNNTYWLNEGTGHKPVRLPQKLQKAAHYPEENTYGNECPGVYYLRLKRDGWTFVEQRTEGESHQIDVFDKPLRAGWVLRKLAHTTAGQAIGKKAYYDEHELVQTATGRTVAYHGWEWADIDRARLVWCEAGKLLAGRVTDEGLCEQRDLHDFNPMAYAPLPVPY